MPRQTQRPKVAQKREEKQVEGMPKPSASATKTKQEIDDLLDEIDGVLEENAEDFVLNYQQKGGQ